MFQNGWHLSIFPKGNMGQRTFDEFHVTQEGAAENKHHFYTHDGHIQLNNLDNIVFAETEAWTHANTMAATFYQKRLNLYVTSAMLQQELDSFTRRTDPVLTMDEYQAQQASKVITTAPPPVVSNEEVIDMFEDDAAPPVQPVPMPAGPQPVVRSIPAVPPPQIPQLPPTALELHELYARYLRTFTVDNQVVRRWSDALDQVYVRYRGAAVADLKVKFDEVFTRGLSL